MLTKLATLAAGAGYWLGLLLIALALEATALYYQYALDYGPCVICIHIRIWVAALALLALAALWLRRSRAGLLLAQGLALVVLAGFSERAWLLLAVEQGRVQGECNFDSGLPAWFALDHWLPQLFQVKEACGITPPLPLGITMAEALLPLAAGLLILNLVLLLASALRAPVAP